MKEFNLEEAKAGKPVCTRDGRRARIICWDMKGGYPIVALIEDKDWGETISGYDKHGHIWCHNFTEDMKRYDLMMAPEKKEGWINLYRTSTGVSTCGPVCRTKEHAFEGRIKADYITTIKIEWEE